MSKEVKSVGGIQNEYKPVWIQTTTSMGFHQRTLAVWNCQFWL